MRSIRPLLPVLFLTILAPLHAAETAKKGEYPDPKRFEKAIVEYETKDAKSPPPQNAIVFYGSSSIVGWHGTLVRDFAPMTVVPRGFGGSTMNDALYYLDRTLLPCKPKAVVIYEGDNDIAAGVSPEKIRDTFRSLIARLRERLPETRVYLLAIKPSPSRWALWPKAAQANKLLREECEKDKRLTFVDTAAPMLKPDGTVREDLFKADRLHMNADGYILWRDVLRPILEKSEQAR